MNKIDELQRLYKEGIIDKETYTKEKMKLLDELLRNVREERQLPDDGC